MSDLQVWQGPWNDELPDHPAYYKIPCADYRELERALAEARAEKETRDELYSLWVMMLVRAGATSFGAFREGLQQLIDAKEAAESAVSQMRQQIEDAKPLVGVLKRTEVELDNMLDHADAFDPEWVEIMRHWRTQVRQALSLNKWGTTEPKSSAGPSDNKVSG